MKKNDEVKKSRKARAEKKAARKPRLTKEEREARKLKLQEERAAKKAARIAKREAKKQKEAEKKAAAKAKREERKAKKAARLLKEKERKAALKLKAKERAEKKRAKAEKKGRALPKEAKLSAKEKIEAERNEWKALSAIRRYVKDNAKMLAALPEEKLAKKIAKLQKMGYEVDVAEDGTPVSIGYSFGVDVKAGKKAKTPDGEKKPRKRRVKNVEDEEVQQPQNSEAEPLPEEEELLTDDEILEAAKADNGGEGVEVLAGDTFADETEVAANAEEIENDAGGDEDEDEDEDDADEDVDNDGVDILGDTGISREQEEYRHEAFREMEANGTWD